jgi:RNA polymerase sigma-70 factor (ECF subfamily)
VSPADASDAELVAQVLAGREAAFTALMRRHKSWLYLFVRRHVATSEDAYDVVQEAFASAWRALKSYDRSRPFDVWLRRIALNKCRDRGRREAVRRRAFAVVGIAPEAVEQVADTSPGAEAVSIGAAALGRLNAAIAALPAKLREPLILTSLQGLSQREAAEVLGVTPKVVEMRAYRARKQLADKLSPADFEDLEQIG